MKRLLATALFLVAASLLVGCDRPGSAPKFKLTDVSGANFGNEFALTDHNGKARTLADFRGKIVVIFFGFTHCPDACPTTLTELAQVAKELGTDAEKMQVLFVTVDPERDGPKEVGRYTALFNTPVIGLTGSPADIERVKKQFGVFSAKVEQPEADYSVDHTAATFLFGPDSRFVATIAPEEGDAAALAKLRRIIG